MNFSEKKSIIQLNHRGLIFNHIDRRLIKYFAAIVAFCIYIGSPHHSEANNSNITNVSNASNSSLKELITILASPSIGHPDKWKAVQEIRHYGHQATPYLLKILNTKDKGKSHYYSIRALAYIKDPDATEVLCKILQNRNYVPRRYAAIALGQIGDPSAVDGLIIALSDVVHVRRDTLDALVKIDSKESRKALEGYHFAKPSKDLELRIECDKLSYVVGDGILIKATLVNKSNKNILLGIGEGEPYGYLVFRRKNGVFVEEVGNGLREERRLVITEAHLHELKPETKVECSFTGNVAVWTKGEKEDHTFVPSEESFLTLNFKTVAFHVRYPGEYNVRLVFKQDDEAIKRLKATGMQEEKLQQFWQGKVVSNAVSFSVIEKASKKVDVSFEKN